MMKRFISMMIIVFIISTMFTSIAFARNPVVMAETAGGGMAAGKAKWVGNIWYSGTEPDYFSEYWNQLTPENASKWASCEQQQGVYNFSAAKAMYDYTRSNGIPFKFHTLVWGSQYPRWMDNLSAEDQKIKVENWIKNAGLNFPDAEYVDVVNEPMPGHAPPRWRNAIGGDNDLYGTGWDWIVWSFEKAREYFPNSKLFINDYNILSGYTDLDTYINVINILKKRGLIDGIGCQGHGLENTSAADVKARLDKLATTGLPIHISEFDLNIADDTTQKNKMQELFPVFYEHPAVEGITLWGYLQGHTWIPNSYLIRSDGTERPALVWLKEYLASIPPSVTGVTLNKSTLSLAVGASEQLIATVEPSNANKNVIWESDNTGVATVDDTGKVTAVAAGTATITVTTVDGGKTATCTVTVTPEAEAPAAVLTAAGSVQSGAVFTAGISLDNLSSSVYAEDIVLSYDADIFEYVGTTGANDNIKVLRADTSAPGTVRLITANIGGVSGASTPVFDVSFKVKAGVENTTGSIAVTSAKLGVPDGSIIEAGLSSKVIRIGGGTPGVDKSQLITAINNAQTLYDNAEVGTDPGKYPQAAKDALKAAIDAAKAVRDDSSATQSQVDGAVTALNNAVNIFKAAVVEEAKPDINDDGIIDVADLGFVAYYYGKECTGTEWQVAKAADMNGDGKIDIEDLAYVASRISD